MSDLQYTPMQESGYLVHYEYPQQSLHLNHTENYVVVKTKVKSVTALP